MIVRAALLLTAVAAHAAAIVWLATAAPVLPASRAELPALLAELVAPPAPRASEPAVAPPPPSPRPPVRAASATSSELPPRRETPPAAAPRPTPVPASVGASPAETPGTASPISPAPEFSPSSTAVAPAPRSGVADAVTPPRADASHLGNPAPRYPPLSRKLGEEGEVVLDLLVGADGRVVEARVQTSSGHPRLDAAALKAARGWRFIPARQGGAAIDYWYQQSIRFALDA